MQYNTGVMTEYGTKILKISILPDAVGKNWELSTWISKGLFHIASVLSFMEV